MVNVRLVLLFLMIVMSAGEFASAAKLKKPPKSAVTKRKARGPASAAKPAKKSAGAQTIMIKTENTFVFETPDIDGSAVGYLSAGEKGRASRKIYANGENKFYKVKLSNGKFGYVLAIDVAQPPTGEEKSAQRKAENKKEKNSRVKRELAKDMIENRWFGLLLGNMSFKEKVAGIKAEDNLIVYGLKITGPDVLLEGPVMDLNIFLHFGSPNYYGQISRVRPSGFVFMADALLLMPMSMKRDSSIYLGVGPYFKYSDFKIIPDDSGVKNPKEMALGASFALGGGWRFKTVAVRLEGKYVVERTTYPIVQLGIQTLY